VSHDHGRLTLQRLGVSPGKGLDAFGGGQQPLDLLEQGRGVGLRRFRSSSRSRTSRNRPPVAADSGGEGGCEPSGWR
jgi:hypothetical protein